MNGMSFAPEVRPNLYRRLAAVLYDGLLLFSILFAAAIPITALPTGIQGEPYFHAAKQVYFALVIFAFFGGFWVYGGQTLGMRAWRLKVVGRDGGRVSWGRATVRFLASLLSWAAAGLGFLWVAVDRDHQAWHDRLSGTRLVLLPKPGTPVTPLGNAGTKIPKEETAQ